MKKIKIILFIIIICAFSVFGTYKIFEKNKLEEQKYGKQAGTTEIRFTYSNSDPRWGIYSGNVYYVGF